MNREEFINYVESTYGIKGDNPWQKNPDFTVYRHIGNQKWFALVMTIKKSFIGIESSEPIDVVNVKCEKSMLGSALENKGFFPAYHMNKENWVTIALDGSASDENIKFFLDISFELTAPKLNRKNCSSR